MPMTRMRVKQTFKSQGKTTALRNQKFGSFSLPVARHARPQPRKIPARAHQPSNQTLALLLMLLIFLRHDGGDNYQGARATDRITLLMATACLPLDKNRATPFVYPGSLKKGPPRDHIPPPVSRRKPGSMGHVPRSDAMTA